ncbi:M91 family zinc metallopeptidase [Dactylosporangium sp. CA-139066]|uniref:M91 family zinc metallopeptidase n=1 Tax=Dactylosporangium sp. CA-139066 TaxID=3239930 RepID=UPI003D8EE993
MGTDKIEVEYEPVIVDNVWELEAQPDVLARAAQAWWAVGSSALTALSTLDHSAAPVLGGAWDGEAAASYRRHYRRIAENLDEMSRAAYDTSAAFDGAAAVLRRGREQLGDAFARVCDAVAHQGGSATVIFRPADAGQVEAVRAAIAEAGDIRSDIERGLRQHEAALARARDAWQQPGQAALPEMTGAAVSWSPPPATGFDARLVDGKFVVQTGAGDDQVTVDDGSVTVGGVRLAIPAGATLVLRTGAGADAVTVQGEHGVTVLGGDGDDRLDGGAGGDTLIAGAGLDTVHAGAGDDRVSLGLLGDGGITHLGVEEVADLGDGDDRLWGSFGNDHADGGAGRDLMFGASAGIDRFDGGAGEDVLDGGAGADELYGGDGADLLSGGDSDDHLEGGAGEDTLLGGAGNDRLDGGGDRDVVLGGDGDDHLDGGAGDDWMDGEAGHDTLYGRDGEDSLHGGEGNDYLDGGAGGDLLNGDDGNDTLYGLDGDDVIDGGAGDDYLEGGAGGDIVDGGGGADVLSGGGGDDEIIGGSGDDVVYSGDGHDVVLGGDGRDTLYGQGDDAGGLSGIERMTATEAGGDDLTGFIKIGGDAEYQARVKADLALLAASPEGREMLTALRGQDLRIEPIAVDNGFATADRVISYNPAWTDLAWTGRSPGAQTPPVAVLFHEMAHIYDYEHGGVDTRPYTHPSTQDDGVSNLERKAVGLAIDDDGDPGTPERLDPDHPADLTENALRAEMGLEARTSYR